jgi:predicted  nucleic acid-binding Zn-ribbon protein
MQQRNASQRYCLHSQAQLHKSFIFDDGCSTDDQAEANYGSGRKFGGAAKKGGSSRRKHDIRSQTKSTLAKVDGCWVCGGDHFAYKKHSKDEIQTALKTLKDKAVKTYISVDSVYATFSASFMEADEEPGEEEEDDRQANLEIVEYMADVSFQCGSSYESDSNQSQSITRGDLVFSSEDPASFKGIILDTGANRASTVSREQCNTYCKMFRVPRSIRKKLPGSGNVIHGIGGSAPIIGTAQLPVPFPGMDLVIDVDLKIVEGRIPSLLSLKDMKGNMLDIQILSNEIW